MSRRLKLWDSPQKAFEAARRTRAGGAIQALPLGAAGHYLKQAGSDDVEPRYLCTDGRWRRYDAIVDLPHSTAQTRAEEALAGG